PMTDALVVPGMRLAVRGLKALAENRADSASAEGMALGALWGGIALANAGLGAVHGLAAPLGGQYPVPHGAACACLLPHSIAANYQALRQRAPESTALARYEDVAVTVAGIGASPERAAASLEKLRRTLGIPPLASFGVAPEGLASVIRGSRAGSMRGNPIELTDEELAGILTRALASPDEGAVGA
ncbi:MAG: iron-containing alcohol dehydrogenase, partial [Acidimicrobiales bacterium]